MQSHHFTVDVEEYFQVAALSPWFPRASWANQESRVEQSVSALLEELSARGATGTFFVLGWVAERLPSVVRAVANAGHEIASHGWDHVKVTDQHPREFRASIRRSKQVLEAITGERVLGFRAPNYSIIPGCEWAFDVLIEEGYRYDSSLFPIRRPGYGYPSAPRDPHWIERPGGLLAEIPPATLGIAGLSLPAAGGAYFRLLPYGLVRAALRQSEARGMPATFYIHPWELDPDQPRIQVPWLTRVRHYGGLAWVRERLRRLLNDFRFTAITSTLATL
jgi:polysaccharide deacetylase family protein (PEP-CTERM system associated)